MLCTTMAGEGGFVSLMDRSGTYKAGFVYPQQYRDIAYGIRKPSFKNKSPGYLDQDKYGSRGYSKLRPHIRAQTETVFPQPSSHFELVATLQPGVDPVASVAAYIRIGFSNITYQLPMLMLQVRIYELNCN